MGRRRALCSQIKLLTDVIAEPTQTVRSRRVPAADILRPTSSFARHKATPTEHSLMVSSARHICAIREEKLEREKEEKQCCLVTSIRRFEEKRRVLRADRNAKSMGGTPADSKTAG